MKENTDAWKQGYVDGEEYEGAAGNPFPIGTQDALDWLCGYATAKSVFRFDVKAALFSLTIILNNEVYGMRKVRNTVEGRTNLEKAFIYAWAQIIPDLKGTRDEYKGLVG